MILIGIKMRILIRIHWIWRRMEIILDIAHVRGREILLILDIYIVVYVGRRVLDKMGHRVVLGEFLICFERGVGLILERLEIMIGSVDRN